MTDKVITETVNDHKIDYIFNNEAWSITLDNKPLDAGPFASLALAEKVARSYVRSEFLS